MPPFIQCRQPPDDDWVTFDLAVLQTIAVRQPPNFEWTNFTIGSPGGAFLSFPTVADMAASVVTNVVDGSIAYCVAERLWFVIETSAEVPIRNVVVTSTDAARQWRQDVLPGVVYTGPARGGVGPADDMADANAVAAREFAPGGHRRNIRLLESPIPYWAAVPHVWQNGETFELNGQRLVADVAVSPFVMGTTAGTQYPIHVAVLRGAFSAIVTAGAAPALVRGDIVQIRDDPAYGYQQMMTVAGPPVADSGGYRIPFEQTTLVPYPVGTAIPTGGQVIIRTAVATHCRLLGRHEVTGVRAQLSGGALSGRLTGMQGACDCEISGIAFDDQNGIAEWATYVSEGGRDDRISDCLSECAPNTGKILTECCEGVVFEKIRTIGTNIYCELMLGGRVVECESFGGRDSASTFSPALGIRDCIASEVRGGTFANPTTDGIGILVEGGSDNICIKQAIGATTGGVNGSAVKVNTTGQVLLDQVDGFANGGGYAFNLAAAAQGSECRKCAAHDATIQNFLVETAQPWFWELNECISYGNASTLTKAFGLKSSCTIRDPKFVGSQHHFSLEITGIMVLVESLHNLADQGAGRYFAAFAAAATLEISDSNFNLANRPAIEADVASVLILRDSTITQTGAGGFVQFGTISVRELGRVNLTGIAVVGPTAQLSRGQVTLNGATPVFYAFPDIAADDIVRPIMVTPSTPGTAPAWSKVTAGTAVLTGTVDLTTLAYPADFGTKKIYVKVHGVVKHVTWANPANAGDVIIQLNAALAGVGVASLDGSNHLVIADNVSGPTSSVEADDDTMLVSVIGFTNGAPVYGNGVLVTGVAGDASVYQIEIG